MSSRSAVRRLATASLAALALAVLLSLGAPAPRANATPLTCPAQFQMLHAESIGAQTFSAGGYEIKVGDPRRLSCDSATHAFSEFLIDFDGVLRKPWVQVPQRLIFSRGTGSPTQFVVRRAAGVNPLAPQLGNPTAYGCPAYVRLSGTDHIGSLVLPAGSYRLTLIDPAQYDCTQAPKQLARFLEDFDGRLSTPWRVDTKTGLFRRGRGSLVGFRIKKAVGPSPAPALNATFPAKGSPRACRSTYGVRSGDVINGLFLASGEYLTFPLRGSGLSCSATTRALTRLLRAKNNKARGWKANIATGTLRKGKRAFRVKPAPKPVAKLPAESRQ